MSQPSEFATRAARSDDPLPQDMVLVVVSGQTRGQRARVKDHLRIGKAPDNDLVLPDDTVSPHHCELERNATGILVRDLSAAHPTRIGRTTVREATLEPGSILTVGDVELLLRSEPDRTQIPPSESDHFGEALGRSLVMRSLFGVLERIAPTDAAVLLEGETGTGKDLIAREIHRQSPRRAQPFIIVDCGTVSYDLLESELFGHERGAFASAVTSRQGAFETAADGTIFLDEVGAIPLDVQPKLLRVLESAEFRRTGGTRMLHAGARIVAATTRDLEDEVKRGKFRQDLYFRLAVVPVSVPPLRGRREDIPALVAHFLSLAAKHDPTASPIVLSSDTVAALSAHDWPGNVRELRDVLDRALCLATPNGDHELGLMGLPVSVSASVGTGAGVLSFSPARSYREARTAFEMNFEQRYVSWLLERHKGNISAAAREVRMDRKHLYDLARKHRLR